MLVGCGKKEEKKKADNSLKDVQSKKELLLGLDSSFPPMGFTDKKDNIVGFDIDLAKEVTKRMGIKLKLQPINWNSKEPVSYTHLDVYKRQLLEKEALDLEQEN